MRGGFIIITRVDVDACVNASVRILERVFSPSCDLLSLDGVLLCRLFPPPHPLSRFFDPMQLRTDLPPLGTSVGEFLDGSRLGKSERDGTGHHLAPR